MAGGKCGGATIGDGMAMGADRAESADPNDCDQCAYKHVRRNQKGDTGVSGATDVDERK